MNLARVDLVEQLAHDKRVEEKGQVEGLVVLLKETRAVLGGAKDQIWPVQAEEVDHKLERGLPEDVLQ